jgi:hypothetical protein
LYVFVLAALPVRAGSIARVNEPEYHGCSLVVGLLVCTVIARERIMDVEKECRSLVQELRRLGQVQESGRIGVKFGTLFDDDKCAQIFEALVGTLLAAKKRGLVSFEGQILLKGAHDDVVIEVLEGERPTAR